MTRYRIERHAFAALVFPGPGTPTSEIEVVWEEERLEQPTKRSLPSLLACNWDHKDWPDNPRDRSYSYWLQELVGSEWITQCVIEGDDHSSDSARCDREIAEAPMQ